jgi:3-hydroxyacyl-CoA dehydrogenase
MAHVEYTLRKPIALIEFGLPPVNSLGYELRNELGLALDRAADDAEVQAIVITGKGKFFSAGADIREFGKRNAERAPVLPYLTNMIEQSAKPVIAALNGTALGGGLELALACHYRVALASAMLGVPESKLGLLPGAGGTQRLPRLVGIEVALNMILGGEPVAAPVLADTALLDAVVDSDVVGAAVTFAQSLLAKNTKPRRVRDIVVSEPNLEALCDFARTAVKAKFANYPAPLHCIDAVQASAQPFDAGLQQERQHFQTLINTVESKALRHVFFADRVAAHVADVPADTAVRDIRGAAVIGAGTMGSGIAICFLNAGIAVTLLETDQAALDRGVARIRGVYEGQVNKGKLDAAQCAQKLELLSPALSYQALNNVDIAIEAVFEEMSVKEKVFRELDKVMKPGAILATNTSTLDVNRIAQFTTRPADVLGLHFFSPANHMKLLEIVRGALTAKEVLATALQLGKKLKKTSVVAGVCDGFIGNRMVHEYLRQSWAVMDAGASPQEIDAAMEAFGFAMGPFRMSDLAGNDVGWYIRKRHATENAGQASAKVADKICELGRFGQKTQAGWYDYGAGGRVAQRSAVVDELIVKHRQELGITPRHFSAEEIVERLVFSLVNVGAQILEEKIAARASDIDVVYLNGYGFPLWRGGPMFYADTVGLYHVVRRIRQFALQPVGDPTFWRPAALLARLAEAGSSFSANDGEAA